jgi:hypothetical protein
VKNFLILLAVVLAGAGVYWKFRDKIHGKVEELQQKADGKGEGGGADLGKSVIPSATAAKGTESSLVDAAFVGRLPDSLNSQLSGGKKADIVIEVTEGEDGGGLPPSIRLSGNTSLETSSFQLPGGAKVGTLLLVHLLSSSISGADATNPQYVLQGTAEPAPASLQDSLRKQAWRVPLADAAPLPPNPTTSMMWVTEFAAKAKRGELEPTVTVEGTLGALRRQSGNQSMESVTCEETKDMAFFFSKGTQWHSNVQEAEQLKKQGHKVTVRMLVRSNDNPKFFAQEVTWRAPIKDKFEYWRQLFADRKMLRNMLALARWSEIRGLGEEARQAYEAAHSFVSRESISSMGKPRVSARVHLADETQDHRLYESKLPASQVSGLQWQQRSIEDEFCAPVSPTYLVFRSNARSESSGDYVIINR